MMNGSVLDTANLTVVQSVMFWLVCLSLLFPLSSCTVEECLCCEDVPATCDYDSTEPGSNITCIANTSTCSTQTCNTAEGQACSQDFIHLFTDPRFHSNCVNVRTCQDDAGSLRGCEFGRGVIDVIKCCCSENNCFVENVTEVIPPNEVSSGAPTVAMVTTTFFTTETTLPNQVSATFLIVISTFAAVVLVVGLAVLVTIVCCVHRYHPKVFLQCSSCCRRKHRRVARQTGITRQFSTRQPWVLQGMVGQGRFGHVYKAVYNGELVAVKVYHNRNSWENEHLLFSLESTQHPNIVHFITSSDSSESGGVVSSSPLQLCLVTRYYPLGSLENYLRGHVLSWQQACEVVRSISCGLKHLHSDHCEGVARGTDKPPIAHRDMKSSNCLVKSESGECVIADLGLALQLVNMDNPSEISNYGQVGTLRYMSPEALEARMNLRDIDSFKQVDMYAFSLIMWEALSRCCVLTPEEVGAYQLPYADLVAHPSLEAMKDIVCSRQLRPPIPSLWSNQEPLMSYVAMMQECWDKDADARLTAANIYHQITELCTSSPHQSEDLSISHAPSSTHSMVVGDHTPNNNAPSLHNLEAVNPILFQEHSQSTPPPCYSPTDPFSNQDLIMGMRPFQTSMPHIMQGGGMADRGGGVSAAEVMTLTPRCTRSLRSSVVPQYRGSGQSHPSLTVGGSGQPHPSLSVRNSLVLGDSVIGHNHTHNDFLPTLAGACLESTSSSSHSILDGIGMRLVEAASCSSNASSGMELNVPTNTDSGIQTAHSNTSHSTLLTDPAGSNCGSGTCTPLGDPTEGGAVVDGSVTMETSFCTNNHSKATLL